MIYMFFLPVKPRIFGVSVPLGGHPSAAAEHWGMLQHLSHLPGDTTGNSAGNWWGFIMITMVSPINMIGFYGIYMDL